MEENDKLTEENGVFTENTSPAEESAIPEEKLSEYAEYTGDPAPDGEETEEVISEETPAEEVCAEEETPAEETPAPPVYEKDAVYKWDGEKLVRAKKRKGLLVFAVCMCAAFVAACVTLAVVMIAWHNYEPGPAPENSAQVAETTSRSGKGGKKPTSSRETGDTESQTGTGEESRSYPGSQTVVISPAGGETLGMADLYDRCSPACCTIYVPVTGGTELGSGFVVDAENGYIVTNQHVIENSRNNIRVEFYNGESYPAELVGSDEMSDIAVLKIEAENLTALPLGDSSALRIGDAVIAIGTPYSDDLAGTLTTGTISGVNRRFEVKDYFGRVEKVMTLLQTDAAINNGNSGGPLINMQGQVIGINVMKLSNQYEGLGFAIPMSSAVTIINNLIDYGKVVDNTDVANMPARLGVTASQLSPNDEKVRESYPDLPEDLPEGVLVVETSEDTAVYKAGLRELDIITEFNGARIETFTDLRTELAKYYAGDAGKLKVYRYSTGEYLEFEFTLEK